MFECGILRMAPTQNTMLSTKLNSPKAAVESVCPKTATIAKSASLPLARSKKLLITRRGKAVPKKDCRIFFGVDGGELGPEIM